MIRVGVLGATGYAGSELVRLLSQHGGVCLCMLTSKSYEGQKMSDIYRKKASMRTKVALHFFTMYTRVFSLEL